MFLAALLVVALEVPALAASPSPCAGRIADRIDRPMLPVVLSAPDLAPIEKPAKGGSYVDPAFGTIVRRVTAVAETEGENAVIKPLYSTMPAWNADESLLLLWHRGRGYELYQGDEPYAFIRVLVAFHPTDIESLLWHPKDPTRVFYPSNYNAQPFLIQQSVSPVDAYAVQHDFGTPPTNCPRGDWTKLLSFGGDPQWMGQGPKLLLGLRCGDLSFLYSITDDRVISQQQIPTGYQTTPAPAPSETFACFDKAVLGLDLKPVRALSMANPYEHASFGSRSDRVDVWNAVAFSGSPLGSLVSHRLDTGAAKTIIGPPEWPPPPSTTHISSIATSAPGWAAVGIVGQHTGQTCLDNEILLANVETGEVCRVAHARTWAGSNCGVDGKSCPWGYWSETHVNLSPSGTRIAWASDWNGGKSVDTYVVDLRRPAVKVKCTTMCSVLSFSPPSTTCDRMVCTP